MIRRAAAIALGFLCFALGFMAMYCTRSAPAAECPACATCSSAPSDRLDLPDWYVSNRLDAIERRQNAIDVRLDAQRRAERYELDIDDDEPPQRPSQELRDQKP